ncbi:MAG TPA: glycosyltransferase family 39 protein [Micavibrio sp.]|nr:glycosyltransferase family 39 protein [Micavibrio sp.]
MKKLPRQTIWLLAVMAVLFLTAFLCRPLLPIDETRYMTVAWEMHLHNGWLSPLTLNFEPYHHKPPMLFWLINAFWSVFGVSRWVGLIPIVLSSSAVLLLTARFIKKIMPPDAVDPLKVTFLMLGSVPFLIYSTLVMFDMTLTMFVLASLLCLLSYAEKRQFRYAFLMGSFIGLGVLTKGPVAYLYVIFPMLLGPLWVHNIKKPASWYGDCFAAIFISLFPVAVWLLPVLAQSDNHFAFWLIWEQTAGRITGNFSDAHVRPFYFYLPLIPLLFAPWIFFPGFWHGLKYLTGNRPDIRFLACWIIPVFLAFCFIKGKQPHYLLPLLPGVILLVYMLMHDIALRVIRNTAVILIVAVVAGQVAASHIYFKNYDLTPIAGYIRENPNHPWAFVRNYHGEVGFLAKFATPIADRQMNEIDGWFEENPDGWAVIRYKKDEDVSKYERIFSQAYRGKKLGIFYFKSRQ